MKKLLLLLFSILISFNSLLAAEITYGSYKNNPSKYDDYLRGLESGIGWYNAAPGIEQFYCQPGTLALGIDTVKNIINGQVEKFNDDGWTLADIDAAPIGAILLMGMNSTFPCN